MKTNINIAWLFPLGLAFSSPSAAFAQLPTLDKQPWLGYFAAYEGRRFNVGITDRGEIKLTPLNDKGVDFGPNMVLPVQIGIEEIQPDGKTDMKVIRMESLKSEQPPTDKLERVVLQGQVSAEAVFEAVIEQKGGVVSIGGNGIVCQNRDTQDRTLLHLARFGVDNVAEYLTIGLVPVSVVSRCGHGSVV